MRGADDGPCGIFVGNIIDAHIRAKTILSKMFDKMGGSVRRYIDKITIILGAKHEGAKEKAATSIQKSGSRGGTVRGTHGMEIIRYQTLQEAKGVGARNLNKAARGQACGKMESHVCVGDAADRDTGTSVGTGWGCGWDLATAVDDEYRPQCTIGFAATDFFLFLD